MKVRMKTMIILEDDHGNPLLPDHHLELEVKHTDKWVTRAAVKAHTQEIWDRVLEMIKSV